MAKINLNTLAIDVSIDEGKKEAVNIAQIKEVISITLKKLSEYDDDEILECISRYKKFKERGNDVG